jgi:hypothetical protein
MKTKSSFLYSLRYVRDLRFARLVSFVFCLALCPSPCALSQIPQGFNYQAIARDGTGAVLPNTSLQAMMYVQSLSTGGTIFWKELHSSITTNSFGLFTLVVGTGTRQTESTVTTFDLIDWSVTPKYLKTQIYYGGSWKDMGTSQLMTVPYAMTSGDLAGTVDKLAVRGTTSSLDEALFEVKNKNGQTIFAVYNEGVRIYVDNGAKGPKGGFAVGGFDMTKATKREYFVVSDDSVRIYLDSNPATKGKKSGFAVGGYDMTKGIIQNYLDVSADSVRIYIDSDPSTKKLKGGFAVGGYDMTKAKVPDFLRVTVDSTRIYTLDTLKGFGVENLKAGVSKNYMKMTPINYFIGHESGIKTTPGTADLGKFNSFMGYQTGFKNTTGKKNVFIGHQSGYTNNADFNVFIGNESGKANVGGDGNTFIGYQSGLKNNSGNGNTFLGFQTGENNTTGYQNTFIGYNSGAFNTTSNRNVFMGWGVAQLHQTGDGNVIIGFQAGSGNNAGEKNIFIGHQAGQSETGSSRLYVDISNTSSPLLWGDFTNRRLVINGNQSHNINTRTFFVNGTAGGTSAWSNDSDGNMKKDIKTIENAVEKVLALRGVTYYWKNELNRDTGRHMGFIAQEAETVIPEVVENQGLGYSMQYSPVTALLVEAFKQQQKQIDNLENTILKLEMINTELIRQINEMRTGTNQK